MKIGEIIELGRHRLMRGDATNREDVMRLIGDDRINLVFTDPPYGIRSVNRKTGQIGSGSARYAECIGDTNTEMFREHYRIIRGVSNNLIIWGGQNFTDVLPVSSGWLWWDKLKNTDKLSFGDGELAWSNVTTKNRKYAFQWNGNNRAGNPKLNEKVHPNQKPVELEMRILEDFTLPGNVILDCFGGSGTTLIASELTGRKCFMMEIIPEYCDVIMRRYEKICGRIPIDEPGLQ